MKNKVEVVMLPDSKPRNVVFNTKTNEYRYSSSGSLSLGHLDFQPQLVYITVSQDVEPIKSGDWFITTYNNSKIYKADKITSLPGDKYGDEVWFGGRPTSTQQYFCRKIIATNDPKLTVNIFDDTRVVGTNEKVFSTRPIPQVQQSFLRAFVANPKGKFEVEFENISPYVPGEWIIPNWKLKLNKDNTINITSVEEKIYSGKITDIIDEISKTVNKYKTDIFDDCCLYNETELTENLINKLDTLFTKRIVSRQRELLITYQEKFYEGIHDVSKKDIELGVDKYLSNL